MSVDRPAETKVKEQRMPYIHPSLSFDDMAEIQALSNKNFEAWFKENQSKTLHQFGKFLVLKANEKYYLLPGVIGKGKKIGDIQIFLAFDVDAKHFFAIKAQNLTARIEQDLKHTIDADVIADIPKKQKLLREKEAKKELEMERKNLEKAKGGSSVVQIFFALGNIDKKVKKEKENEDEYALIAMPLEEGINMEELQKSKQNFPQGRWLQFGINMLKNIHELHKLNILHCDIKLPNFIINAVTDEVSAVDFDSAKECKDSLQFKTEIALGAPGYIAPEYLKTKQANEKTEVYSAGIALAKLYGLAEKRKHTNVNDPDRAVFFEVKDSSSGKRCFPDKEIREKVVKLLQQMTAEDPKLRPSMETAIQNLQSIYECCPDMASNMRKTALINLAEYCQTEPSMKTQMKKALLKGNFDEIQFIDPNATNEKEWALLRKEFEEFENHKLKVGNKIYTGPSVTDVVKHLEDRKSEHHFVRSYFYVSNDTEQRNKIEDVHKEKGKEIVCCLRCAEPSLAFIPHEITRHLERQQLTANQVGYIQKRLLDEITSLYKNHGPKNEGHNDKLPAEIKVDDPVIDRQIRAIQETQEKIKLKTAAADKKGMTYTEADQELQALGNKIKTTSFRLMRSESEKSIVDAIEEIRTVISPGR